MIRLTLAQMRLSLGRLIPAGLAIVLGTAFVAATLIAGNVMTSSAYDQVTAQYASADLVVTDATGGLDADSLATVRGTEGVTAAAPLMTTWVAVGAGSNATGQLVVPAAQDSALSPLTIATGRAPTGPDEIALPADTAERIGASVGQTVRVEHGWDESGEPQTSGATLVGLVADPHAAWTMWGSAGLATVDTVAGWSGSDDPTFDAILVATPDPAATTAALHAALGDGPLVRPRQDVAAEQVASLTEGSNVLVMVVLAFAAIALLVAGLVIANTFQVLVAQRTRTLALLRCVGARRRQLRSSVLIEGTLLGLTASVVGVLLGIGLGQAALVALGRLSMGIPLPDVVPLSIWVVVAPLLVGTAVTVGASFVPARAAGAVAPVAALRPADAPSVRRGAGRIRLACALLLTVGGAALLVLATVASVQAGDFENAAVWLGLGMLGGALSFVGVLIGAVLWMPRVVSGLGAPLGRLGAAAQLAAANTLRNPRRTAATSAALLIGVTLVVTMSTGAATARHSLDTMLDEQYSVDLSVAALADDGDASAAALAGSVLPAVTAVEGVAQAVPVRGTVATIEGTSMVLLAVTPEQARLVLHDTAQSEAIARGDAVVPDAMAATGEITASLGSAKATVDAVGGWGQSGSALVPIQTLDRLDPDAPVTQVWAQLASGASATQVLVDVQDAIGDQQVWVVSGAAERQQYQRVIDVMLAIVVALLAVAVVIALIGVANTLSLSVLERRRESATLRSLGMTRRQLRGSLAVEGVLVALVGTGTGIVLGLLYGWAGSLIIFGPVEGTRLAVPWADLLGVLAVAVAAGALASALPARSAVRTPPVAALAVE